MQQQLTLDAALADKARVLDLVALNNQGFVKTMRNLAIEWARAKGSVSSDDLRFFADQVGVKPASPHAWGTIFKGKVWRLLDRRPSLYPGNRAREIKVWGLR